MARRRLWKRAPARVEAHEGGGQRNPRAIAVQSQPVPRDSVEQVRNLHRRYAGHPAYVRSLWSEGFIAANIDLRRFRANNAYVWQRYCDHEVYARSYDAVAQRAPTLLNSCREDGAFGASTAEVDGRLVSRDLLDSVSELSFLEENMGGLGSLTALDLGAGYGRLGHRASEAIPDLRVHCADAIPESTFISRFYLEYRHANATVLALDELDRVASQRIDIAFNVHTFPEWPYTATKWWLEWLVEREVPVLFVVPNEFPELRSSEANGTRRDLRPLLCELGYDLVAQQLKYENRGRDAADWLFQDVHLLYARH